MWHGYLLYENGVKVGVIVGYATYENKRILMELYPYEKRHIGNPVLLKEKIGPWEREEIQEMVDSYCKELGYSFSPSYEKCSTFIKQNVREVHKKEFFQSITYEQFKSIIKVFEMCGRNASWMQQIFEKFGSDIPQEIFDEIQNHIIVTTVHDA